MSLCVQYIEFYIIVGSERITEHVTRRPHKHSKSTVYIEYGSGVRGSQRSHKVRVDEGDRGY